MDILNTIKLKFKNLNLNLKSQTSGESCLACLNAWAGIACNQQTGFNHAASVERWGHRSWPAESGCFVQKFWMEVTFQSHTKEIYGKQVLHFRSSYVTFAGGCAYERKLTEELTGYYWRRGWGVCVGLCVCTICIWIKKSFKDPSDAKVELALEISEYLLRKGWIHWL